MQYEIFTIPMEGGGEVLEKMNRFLRGNKVVQVDKKVVEMAGMAYWTFCIQYLTTLPGMPFGGERKEKIDYKNVLSEEQFSLFCQMRACRKQIAEEDAVPAYAVFTDAELASLAKMGNLDKHSLLKVDGVGKKKIEKYGSLFLDLMRNMQENKLKQDSDIYNNEETCIGKDS